MSAMPIGACSNALRNRSCASRSSASARRRSVRSRALMTMPSTAGSSSRLRGDRLDDAPAAVGVTEADLDPVRVLAGARVRWKPRRRQLAVVGVDEVEHVGADQRLDVEPEDALGHRARVHETAVGHRRSP